MQLEMTMYERRVLPLQEHAHGDWLDVARRIARRLAVERGKVTIDDVRALCPPPRDVDPRVMGAVFKPAKEWVCVGYERSGRDACNGRPIGVWQLT